MIKTDNVFCLTENQTKIINDLIKEFNIKNEKDAEESAFPFFDDLINQSAKDKLEIVEYHRKHEIIKDLMIKTKISDYEKLKPYIEKCGLSIMIDSYYNIIIDQKINIEKSYSENRIRIGYIDKTQIITLKSGLTAIDCTGFFLTIGCVNEQFKSIDDVLNEKMFKYYFKTLFNKK
jgi:hypothetical protein